MADLPDGKTAAIAGLLNKLADLSGDGAALEAYRREADLFDPALVAAEIALDLLAVETEAEGRAETRRILEHLLEAFRTREEYGAAAKIADGLRSFDAAGDRS
ncbi:MAG: hypothetical protein ACHQ49_15875 [Elusimicrobiota bacterium]